MEKNIKVKEHTLTITATIKVPYKLGNLKHNKASVNAIKNAIEFHLGEIDTIPLYIEKDSSGTFIEEETGPVVLEKVIIS